MTQTSFYTPSPWGEKFHGLNHNEALGGGSAGPGKSMVLLFDPLQQVYVEHERCLNENSPYYIPWGTSAGWALHLRRTRPMLEPTLQRAHRCFKLIDPDVKWNENKCTFTFRSGYKYQFGHCHESGDWQNFLSFEFCMAAGQRIRMADGSLRAIEDVVSGDMVSTLEGPRRVTATWNSGRRPCVSATTEYRGVTVGTQVFPTTHPVLLWPSDGSRFSQSPDCNRTAQRERPHGWCWQDFESLLCERPESPVIRASLISAGSEAAMSCGALPEDWQLRELTVPVVLHGPALRSTLEQRRMPMGSHARHRSLESSESNSPALEPRVLSSSVGQLLAEREQLRAQDCSEEPCDCGAGDELTDLEITRDSRGRCLFCLRLRGEPPQRSGADDRSRVGQPADAAGCVPRDLFQAAPERVPTRSPFEGPFYPHFYSGERRVRTEDVRRGLCRLRYAGEFQTFDLTVEGANHYIGEFGIVSTQTHIGFDELIQFEEEQYDQIITRLRTSDPVLRSMLKIRAMSNPLMGKQKGDSFSIKDPNWVRRRFIDPAPQGEVTLTRELTMMDGRKEKRTRIYLHATLKDNPDKDFVQQYEVQLQSAKPHIRQALLYGDWYMTAGAFYGDVWNKNIHVCKPFAIPAEWPKFRSMDWGFRLPGVVHWYALDPDDTLFCFREMVFKEQTDKEVAKAIKQVETGYGLVKDGKSLLSGPADTQLWEKRGDTVKSKAQVFAEHGVNWFPADKRSRIRNAELVVKRLSDHAGGSKAPGLVFFDTCEEIVKLLPAIGTNPDNSEEPADGKDDHAHDVLLYAAAAASHGKAGIQWRDPELIEDEQRVAKERKKRGRWGYGSSVM